MEWNEERGSESALSPDDLDYEGWNPKVSRKSEYRCCPVELKRARAARRYMTG